MKGSFKGSIGVPLRALQRFLEALKGSFTLRGSVQCSFKGSVGVPFRGSLKGSIGVPFRALQGLLEGLLRVKGPRAPHRQMLGIRDGSTPEFGCQD